MTIRVLPAAERDIAEALAWYDARSPSLGDRLLDEVDAAMARIRDTPMVYRTVHGPVRRAAVRVFPYFIWFVLEDDLDRAHVIAVTHHRRDPTDVRSQMSQRRPG